MNNYPSYCVHRDGCINSKLIDVFFFMFDCEFNLALEAAKIN